MHIEAVNLADGDYELVPADSRAEQVVNVNCTNLSQDLGQAPEAFLPDFPNYHSAIYLLMYCNIWFSAFKFCRRDRKP